MDMSIFFPQSMNLGNGLLRGFDPFGTLSLIMLALLNYCILYLGVRRETPGGWDNIRVADRIVLSLVLSLVSVIVFTLTTGVFLLLSFLFAAFFGLTLAQLSNAEFTSEVLRILIGTMVVPISLVFSACQTPLNVYRIVRHYRKHWDSVMNVGFFHHGWHDTFKPKGKKETAQAIGASIVFISYLSASAYVGIYYLSRLFGLETLKNVTGMLNAVITPDVMVVALLSITLFNLVLRLTLGRKWELRNTAKA